MVEILSREMLLGIYERDTAQFKMVTDNETITAISIAPIELNNCRFRLTLFMQKGISDTNVLKKAILVAVTKQAEQYADMDTSKIHTKWLSSLGITPTRTELYGNVYELGDVIISAEHDPRSDSDEIIVTYLRD